MKKILIILSFFVFAVSGIFGQQKYEVDYTAKLYCSQKLGFSMYQGTFLLTVIVKDSTMLFNTETGQEFQEYKVTKKTAKYVIGKDYSHNYSFFDIEKKQFYYIDYFANRYTVNAYGEGYSSAKQNIIKMMDLLKSGSTQKDVIKFLIEQAEMDF